MSYPVLGLALPCTTFTPGEHRQTCISIDRWADEMLRSRPGQPPQAYFERNSTGWRFSAGASRLGHSQPEGKDAAFTFLTLHCQPAAMSPQDFVGNTQT